MGKRIKWNPGMGPAKSYAGGRQINPSGNVASTRLEPRFSRVDDNEKIIQQNAEHMVVGSLWRLTRDMMTLTVWDRNLKKDVPAQGEFPVLVECFKHEDARFPKGMIAIYTGAVYADELANNVTVRVWRPTFIVANGRFIIKDLKNLEPVA